MRSARSERRVRNQRSIHAPRRFDEQAAAELEAGSGLPFGLLAAFDIERIVDFLQCAGLLPRDRTSPVASAGRPKQ
jgi:hypothetical protein